MRYIVRKRDAVLQRCSVTQHFLIFKNFFYQNYLVLIKYVTVLPCEIFKKILNCSEII